MTPEQISVISAVASIIERLGTWPIGSVIVVVIIAPWGVQVFLSLSHERRFKALQKMYENNVELVKTTQQLAENMQDLVIHSVQTMTEVKDIAKNNLFCPIVRKETTQKEIDR